MCSSASRGPRLRLRCRWPRAGIRRATRARRWASPVPAIRARCWPRSSRRWSRPCSAGRACSAWRASRSRVSSCSTRPAPKMRPAPCSTSACATTCACPAIATRGGSCASTRSHQGALAHSVDGRDRADLARDPNPLNRNTDPHHEQAPSRRHPKWHGLYSHNRSRARGQRLPRLLLQRPSIGPSSRYGRLKMKKGSLSGKVDARAVGELSGRQENDPVAETSMAGALEDTDTRRDAADSRPARLRDRRRRVRSPHRGRMTYATAGASERAGRPGPCLKA
ncbi:hypothetical protein PSAC2689_50479 [Paraburkholderia sacchari]